MKSRRTLQAGTGLPGDFEVQGKDVALVLADTVAFIEKPLPVGRYALRICVELHGNRLDVTAPIRHHTPDAGARCARRELVAMDGVE